jgi:hypothetical protein
MTAPAVAADTTPAAQRVAGVASIAIHGSLTVPRTATVLGTSGYAVWLLVDESVIVVSTRDATRLPNGIEIPSLASDNPFEQVHHGAPIKVGFGRVMLEGLAVNVARWWDPRPVLHTITADELANNIAGLPADVPDVESDQLGSALCASSPNALLAAARPLLGKGSGLTPESDDYLAGAVASIRLLSQALGHDQATRMLDAVSNPLAKLADARTTTFSAALIQYALRGQVAAPAGSLMRAFAGRGDVAPSHRVLLKVGHSSGPALAAGMVLGAHSLITSIVDGGNP